jgi:uncharacterized protein YegL
MALPDENLTPRTTPSFWLATTNNTMNVTTNCYGNTLAVRLSVAGDPPTAERPLSIAFLLDNSGSMDGPRMDSVKRTLHAARTLLRSEDRVTLVTFSEVASVVLNHHSLTGEGLSEFYVAVDNIRADASTNLAAGIEALFGCGSDYDTVILLTDGIVNAGITSTAGLRAMALAAAGTLSFNALGYGADHNRTLLRDIATRSQGTYTFVDSDEILPIAMADILSGARSEVFRDVRVAPPAGWTSLEIGGERVGSMVGGRDYWVVFNANPVAGVDPNGPAGNVMVSTATRGVALQSVAVERRPDADMPPDVTEQRFRARVAAAMVALSDRLENGGHAAVTETDALTALREEIEALPAETRMRPLMLRLLGQIAEILSIVPSRSLHRFGALGAALPPAPALRANAMARLASGATTLCTQRGVYSMAPAGEDPVAALNHVSFFSTPTQRSASSAVHATYSRVAEDDDADAPDEPLAS